MRLADAAGLDRLVAGHVGLAGAQAASTPLKIGCLVTGMLMGADSIDDMNVLRDCGLHHVLTEVRAPPALGSFLRAFHHGNVRQLDAVHRRLLAGHQRASRAAGLAVERARYDADRAERAFCQVEPENRLVARSLETRGEARLAALTEAEQALEAARDTLPPPPSRDDLEKLAADRPALWNAPTTSARDRKRLLRTLIADVTVLPEPDRSKARIGIRWHTDDRVAEPGELALYPSVPPGRVAGGHADHQRADRGCRGRPPGTRPRVIPCACDQPPVPGEQCRRGHPGHLTLPAPGDPPRQGREPPPVARLVADPADLAAQHRVLVPERQEFGILGHLAPGQHHQTAEQATYDQVEDRKDHSGMIPAHNTGQDRPGEIE